MDFARMKRRELQELCRRHGLAARGSKADLAAGLAGALSGNAAAAAGAKLVGVVAGKGCLKRPGGGSSGAAKTVKFALEERTEAGEALPAAAVSGRGHLRKCVEIGGGSTDEGDAGEVGASDPVTQSRMNAMSLHADSGVESQKTLAEAEVAGEMVGAAVDRKRKIQDNAKDIAANAQAGVSHRGKRKSSSFAGADSEVGSRNNHAEVDDEGDVTGEAVCMKRKTRRRRKVEEILPTAAVSRRGRQQKRTEELGGASSAEGVIGEVGADSRVTRSKSTAVNLSAGDEVESRNIFAKAEVNREVLQETGDRKLKRKIQKDAEDTVADIHADISCRGTGSSSLSADLVLLCPVVEEKRGRRAKDCKDELDVDVEAAEVQDLTTAASNAIVKSRRGRSKGENSEPATQMTAKDWVIRSCSVEAAVMLPIVVENKRVKTKDVHQDRELPIVLELDVSTYDVPMTRSLRSRVIQLSNTMLVENHAGKKLEKKRQP